MHLIFYIGLGVGLAIAAGIRPFLPALVAGALGAAGALGVAFAHGPFSFLQSAGWLAAAAVLLLASYVVQSRLGSQAVADGRFGVVLLVLSVVVGALLFAGTLADHRDAWWPGLIAGGALGALSHFALRPLLTRTRARLGDRSARDALTLYLDGAALVLAAIAALFHPLGFLAVALIAWLAVGSRRRAGEKYAGLRILRQ